MHEYGVELIDLNEVTNVDAIVMAVAQHIKLSLYYHYIRKSQKCFVDVKSVHTQTEHLLLGLAC